MNWIILALTFQVILGLVTIIVLKVKYGFSIEMNSGSTQGMQILSSKDLDWSDKKIQFYQIVYFLVLSIVPVIVIMEILIILKDLIY